MGWLAWFGLVPLLWSLTHIASDRNQKRYGFLLGFVAGSIYFLITFRWFWSLYPLDTFGIHSKILSFALVLLIYLVSSVGMAVFWGIFGLVIGKSKSNQSLITNYQLLTPPALFALLEYAQSWGFGFLWAGSGSLFGPHWTMGNLAYALVSNSLALKLTSFVGIYGVTFLIVFLNYLIFTILISKLRPTKMPIVMGIFVGILLFAITFGPKLLTFSAVTNENTNPPSLKATKGQRKINFAIIQTAQQTKLSPSPQESLAGFKKQLELLNRVARKYPESQLIVFPEASDFFKNISLLLTPAQIQNYFTGLFKKPSLIISGSRIIEPTGLVYSRVFSLDTQNDILGFYDKRLLMPGGEFLPYPIRAITNLFSKFTVSQFGKLRELNVGKKVVSTLSFRDKFNIAPLICSELVSPNITRQTTQNADVIVSMASYGIFHGNRTIADQILAITRFRAAENGKSIIIAVNVGRSYVIDNRGDVVFLAQNNNPQILTGRVDVAQQKSWYNKFGDFPIILASLLLVMSSILLTWFKKSRRS